MPLASLALRMPGTFHGVRDTLAQLCDGLARDGFGAEDIGRIEIAVAEALNNVIEHATLAHSNPRILIASSKVAGYLVVTIIDDGTPLPEGVGPRGKSLNFCPAELPEGGFGWTLIETLTSWVDYRRANGSNQLSLSFQIDGADANSQTEMRAASQPGR